MAVLTHMNEPATVYLGVLTDCGTKLALVSSPMTTLRASRESASSRLLDPSESLTDPIVDPQPVEQRELAERSLAELSIEQLARLASQWADEIIPRPSHSRQLVTSE